MSDDEGSPETQVVTAEYKDGQLEIVEVAPYSKGEEGTVVEGTSSEGGDDLKYVLDSGGKNVVVDLLNLTLVRCADGEQSYRLVAGGDDATVTCVLADQAADDQNQNYVVVNTEEDSLTLLQSELHHPSKDEEMPPAPQKPPLTPAEILERAKKLQKAKALLKGLTGSRGGGGRGRGGRGGRRRGALPPPHELLASPDFKLFLYSCKLCSFKCNAIKELTAHKSVAHAGSSGAAGGGRGRAPCLQCAHCPFRAHAHAQLLRHVHDKHASFQPEKQESSNRVFLDSAEVEAADILVCGACGFESGSRIVFKKHIEDEHGVTAC